MGREVGVRVWCKKGGGEVGGMCGVGEDEEGM